MPEAYPTRAGKRAVTVYLRQEAWRQLKQMALDEDRRLQDVVREAIDLLFKQRRLPQIARED